MNQFLQKIKTSLLSFTKNRNSQRIFTEIELNNLFESCMAGKRSSVDLIIEQAWKGDPKAQEIAGRIYFGGHCVPIDYLEATFWFSKSADQDNADAQCSLAGNFREGWGSISMGCKW